jgi:hypothetical protein
MKRNASVHWPLRLLAVATVLMLAWPALAADEVIDRVLAVAGGEIILLSDVRAARELGRVDPGDAADPTRAVLRQLVDRALVLTEVDRFAPPEPSSSVVEGALTVVIARFPSEQEFDATLHRLGLTRAGITELLREDLRIRAYLDRRFTAATIDEQRIMIDSWIGSLRRRADVIELY